MRTVILVPAVGAALALVGGIILSVGRTVAQTSLPSTEGTIRIKVFGPDLKPLAGHDAVVTEPERFHRPNAVNWISTEPIAADGTVSVTRPRGSHHLDVAVHGIGFGTTGEFQVKTGEAISVTLPPLAPFATVEGQVDRELLTSKSRAKLAWHGMTNTQVRCDAAGHFVFHDVMPGEYWVSVVNSKDDRRTASTTIVVSPGERVRDLQLHPEVLTPAQKKGEERVLEALNGPRDHRVSTWAAGTVRDASRKPIEGVEVYGIIDLQGGIRQYNEVSKAVTDARGRYELRLDQTMRPGGGVIIAHRNGSAPAFAWVGGWVERATGAQTQPAGGRTDIDLVLPTAGGALEIRPLHAGKPAIGARVQVDLENGPFFRGFPISATPARGEVDQILEPETSAGPDGMARFSDLLPGNYRIAVAAGANPRTALRAFPGSESKYPTGTADGVPLRSGQSTIFTLPLAVRTNKARFKLAWPDGKPFAGRTAGVSWAGPLGGGWNSSAQSDADGGTERSFESAGIWRVRFAFRDTPIETIPVTGAAYRAEAIIPITSLLQTDKPIELTAAWRNGSSLEVRLQDEKGRPLRGVVIAPGFFDPEFAGSTDIDGRVRVDGLPSGTYRLQAYAPGIGPADLGGPGTPIPTVASLSGHRAFITTTVTLGEAEDAHIVLKPQPIGYIHGALVPPKGLTPAEYGIGEYYTDTVPGKMTLRYDRHSGEFAYGPFTGGKAYVQIFRTDGSEQTTWTRVLTPGEVADVRIPLTAGGSPQKNESDQAIVGLGGISMHGDTSNAASGRVFLADGKTPAWGAVVQTFVPDQWQPIASSMADASGELKPHGEWYTPQQPGGGATGSPTDPVAVAWLPGTAGATIIPLAQVTRAAPGEYRFVLPKPVTARGKVTWGDALSRQEGRHIRVVAAHEGLGKIDQALTIRTTAQADGSFELPGLSAGTYQVQAAIDDVWFSTAATVAIKNNDPPPLTLAVPDPGRPIILQLRNSDGSPLRDRDVTIDAPDGPLARALWIRQFHTDGTGRAFVAGVPAGVRAVHLSDGKTLQITVPRLEGDATPIEIQP